MAKEIPFIDGPKDKALGAVQLDDHGQPWPTIPDGEGGDYEYRGDHYLHIG